METCRAAGAVPFRRRGGEVEILLVTSRKGRWIFPKGIIERGDSPEDTARKETEEESGVTGSVVGPPLGVLDDSRRRRGRGTVFYLLAYDGEVEPWIERGFRRRRWCTFDAASELLERDGLRSLLAAARQRIEAGSAAADGGEGGT